jgi:hypothetical protein
MAGINVAENIELQGTDIEERFASQAQKYAAIALSAAVSAGENREAAEQLQIGLDEKIRQALEDIAEFIPNLTIGTVVAGEEASVTITGTSAAPVINFVLPRGNTGLQGVKGDTGLQGLKGNDGSPGAPGAAGAKGDTGATGAKGDTGAAGAAGAPGVKGDKGDTGAPGILVNCGRADWAYWTGHALNTLLPWLTLDTRRARCSGPARAKG